MHQAASLRTRLLAAVKDLPGVQSAAIAMVGLMHGTGIKNTAAPEGQIAPRSDFLNSSMNFISPDYFETMRIPLLAGRNFRPDEPESKPNSRNCQPRLCPALFPTWTPSDGNSAIGIEKIVACAITKLSAWSAMRSTVLCARPSRRLFTTSRYSDPKYVPAFILHVRTKNQPEAIIQSVRRALNQIDPRLPFFEIRTLSKKWMPRYGRNGCWRGYRPYSQRLPRCSRP